MGFPRFWGRLTRDDTLIGPDLGEGKKMEDHAPVREGHLSIIWSFAYYVLLVVGALNWYRLLWPMTESSSALATLSKPA